MRVSLIGPCVVAGLLACSAASGAAPANSDCLACHDDKDAKRADGTSIALDAKAFETSKHGPMACVDCHADLATLTEFPHADTLAKVNCASCHDDIGAKYHDSIHARARERAGLIVAPTCSNCHGKHDIRDKTDRSSRVFRTNVAATCGTCHAGIRERYDVSVHAAALKKDNARAPVCIDCHTAHSIQRADTDAWRLDVPRECGTCHAESLRTYRDTFHGQVTSLGFVRVAACADCHGAHDIQKRSDPRAMVSEARIVETCRACHSGANRNFVLYDPHADRHDRARNPVLYYAARFMDGLLIAVFTFFGIHTTAWLWRGAAARRGVGRPTRER